MRKEQKKAILQTLSTVRIGTTKQISRFFTNAQPEKRASETLLDLQGEKLVEGKCIQIGLPKVWRLTKKGRDFMGCSFAPVPFNSPKIPHYIEIGNVYLDCLHLGELLHFTPECREPFILYGQEKEYCPDIFMIWKGRAYCIEVQLTPISSTRWGEKWKVAETFFGEGHFKRASWQKSPTKIIKPRLVVLTKQRPETVTRLSSLPVIVTDHIAKIPSLIG